MFDELFSFRFINDQLFFEVLPTEIVGKTISYATDKKREETRLEKQVTEEIRLPEKNINANDVTPSDEKKTELQAIRKNDWKA